MNYFNQNMDDNNKAIKILFGISLAAIGYAFKVLYQDYKRRGIEPISKLSPG